MNYNNQMIEGCVEKAKVYNNNFYRIRVKDSKNKKYTMVGNAITIIEEFRYYRFSYYTKIDPKYGESKVFTDIMEIEKNEEIDVVKLISSNIDGIGKATAEAVYKALGTNAMNLLMENPDIINTIDLKEKKKELIKEYFTSTERTNRIMLQLQEFGLSYKESADFLEQSNKRVFDPIEKINQNPYELITFINTIGFEQADSIAKNIGFRPDHPLRLENCIYYHLKKSEESGNSYMNYISLVDKVQRTMQLSLSKIENMIADLELSKSDDLGYIKHNEDIYLERTYQVEKYLPELLHRIMNQKTKVIEVDTYIEAFNKDSKIPLSEKQAEAVKTALDSNISLLTGRPGAGKTQSLKGLIYCLEALRLEYKLCAPTGMASKKMKQATGRKASTIHKLLEWDERTKKFTRNKDNKIEAEFFVIDESSMVNMFVFANFLNAIGENSKILFVGDTDQLEPVGIGKVFKDMIDSKAFYHTHLDKIYRQGKGSTITENANRLLDRQPLILRQTEGFIEDFFYFERNNTDSVKSCIRGLIKEDLNNYRKSKGISEFDTLKDIQVLMPKREDTPLSVKEFNKELQAILNPKNNDIQDYRGFRLGDKVIHLKNIEAKDVINGDVGFITKIENKSIFVRFDDKDNDIEFKGEEINALDLAYSCTVHKSQGSEYPVVIIPIVAEDTSMLYLNLVYTAITRGKAMVIVVGDINVLNQSLYARKEQRKTKLCRFIQDKFNIKVEEQMTLEMELSSLSFEWN